jgi:hypothetical protein
LPADVRAACAGRPRAAWVATPLHLRSLVQATADGPRCSAVVTSTMPLTEAVARRSEQLCAAPVLEIYGSTETGALALRRTARETRWRPLAEVRLESSADGMVATGSHFAGPIALADVARIDPGGSFVLLGRSGQDRRSARLARRPQPAARGVAGSRGRRLLPAGRGQPGRAALPGPWRPAARPRRDRAMVARAPRSGVPAALLHLARAAAAKRKRQAFAPGARPGIRALARGR